MQIFRSFDSLRSAHVQTVSKQTLHPVFLAAGLLCLLMHPHSLSAQQFQTAITTVGYVETSIATGDFNHDGLMDVATAGLTEGTSEVTVLLSNGNGTFRESAEYQTLSDNSIATADLDGDKNLDLIIAGDEGNVGVMLGKGDGTFGDRVNYSIGGYPDCVVTGDFNNDGKIDVAVCNATGNAVVVLLGNGDGTLKLPTAFPVGAYPDSIGVADFNNDRNLDLIVANNHDNTVSILLGNGNGTFQSAKSHNIGAAPFSVTTADFNNDGNADFAVASAGVYIFLGNGDGTFGMPKTYPNVGGVLVATDLNGDGKADLVSGGSSTFILWGQGDGTFTVAGYAPGGAGIAVGDFNGDGRSDIAATDPYDVQLDVLLANKDSTFEAPRDFGTPNQEAGTAVGDFNNDGNQDIAAAEYSPGVAILLGDGHGGFANPVRYSVGTGVSHVATGDFNHDGNLDLAVVTGNKQAGAVAILLGNGNGTFQQPVPYPYFNASGEIVLGDFNGDGKLDIAVVAANSIGVLLGNGDGSFRPGAQISLTDTPSEFATADFDGDGILDLAVIQSASVNIFLGNGDGTFRPGQQYSEDEAPASIAVGDFNRDGRADFVVSDGLYGTFFVFLGNGDGTFVESAPYDSGDSGSVKVVVGDLNGDGKQDLVIANECFICRHVPGYLSYFIGNGDGTFQSPINLTASTYPYYVTLSDFNNDGADDLLGSPYLSVSLNLGGTFIQVGSSPNPSKHGQPVTFAAKVTRSVQAVTKPAGPTGTVTFYDGNSALGTATLKSGVAKFTTSGLSVGTHSIRALYSGDGNYNRHLSDVYKQQVTQ